MTQFQVLNPLGALAGVQGAVSQGQTIRQQRQQNRLSELMEPYKMQQAQMQQEQMQMQNQRLQGTISDEDRVRLGRDAKLYVELFGPDLPETLEEADTRHKMAVQGMGRAGVNIEGMPDGFDPNFFDQTTAFAAEFSWAGGKSKVGSQEILSDGTLIQSTPAGPRVFSADGKLLKGKAAADAVRAAREFEAENQRSIYEGRRSGTLGADIELGGAAEAAKEAGKGAEQTRRGLIDDGLDAVEQIPNLTRTLELLDEVRTGGMQTEAALRLKQTFGIEGADEGELSARLGKAVLGQLRATFGAQFTQQEGERLQRIEAGFGKNTETNRRLIGDALNSVIRTAKRGLRAAEKAGDEFAAEEIRESLARLEKAKEDNSKPSGGAQPATGLSQQELSELEALRRAQR